ncbi:MAG: hypothetical protein EOP84_23105, partial [Verrucomicrobiaceae bacterium]
MKPAITTALVCLTLGSLTIAATSKAKRLTPQRIAELTAPSDAPQPKAYKIEITGLQKPSGDGPISVTFPADKPHAEISSIRELRFPSAFAPPEVTAQGDNISRPTFPTAFETVNTGWTIRFSAKPHGKIVALHGIA